MVQYNTSMGSVLFKNDSRRGILHLYFDTIRKAKGLCRVLVMASPFQKFTGKCRSTGELTRILSKIDSTRQSVAIPVILRQCLSIMRLLLSQR